MEEQEQQEQTNKQIEYCCGYNTVSGAFHKPNCDGSCGYENPMVTVEKNKIQRKLERSKND